MPPVKPKVCWSELLLKRKGGLHSTKIAWPCGESSIRHQKQAMKDAALVFFGLKSRGEQPSFWDLLGELARIRFVNSIEWHNFFLYGLSKRLISRREVFYYLRETKVGHSFCKICIPSAAIVYSTFHTLDVALVNINEGLKLWSLLSLSFKYPKDATMRLTMASFISPFSITTQHGRTVEDTRYFIVLGDT